MDLIDRYLHAVRTFLPKAQQDDIVGELSEDLHAQAEEREAELGRSLTIEEQEAIVRPYGRPMLLAARYRPKQHLIGPTVYPFYVNVLKIALLIALVVHAVLAIVLAATGSNLSTSLGVLGRYPGVAVLIVGWMTVAFAIIDRVVPSLSAVDKWNPRSLPPVPPARHHVPRFDTAIEIVTTAAAVCWWLAVPGNQWLTLGPATSILALGPGWEASYLPVLVLLLFSLVLQVLDLARPYRGRGRTVAWLVSHVAGLVLVLSLMRVGGFVVVAAQAAANPSYPKVAEAVNAVIAIGLVVSALVLAFSLVRDVLRLRRISLPAIPSMV